jgi:tetratricopeptide (TPR) repeat protein
MESILEADPEYTWGWLQLGRWYRALNAIDRYLMVANELVRLDPQNWLHQATLGEARELDEDLDGAKTAYAYASGLNPDHVDIGIQLFELQLQLLETDAAEQTLVRFRPKLDDAVARALEIRWHAANMRHPETLEGLEQLLSRDDADADEDQLWKTINAAYTRWPRATNHLLTELLARPETHPVAGAYWIRSYAKDEHWRACRKQLDSMDPGRTITHQASIAFMETLCHRRRLGQLLSFVRGHGSILQADPTAWGTAIWALVQLKKWNAAIRCGRDWQSRQGLEPWMLFHLALGHRSVGQFEEAYQIHLRAKMLPADASSPQHALWLAVEEALRGEPRVAQTWLNQASKHPGEAPDRFLAKLARALLTATDPTTRAEAGGDAGMLRLLGEVRSELPLYNKQPAFRSIYRRAIRCIRGERRGLGAVGWYLRIVGRC